MMTDLKYWLLKAKLEGATDHFWLYKKMRKARLPNKNKPGGRRGWLKVKPQ